MVKEKVKVRVKVSVKFGLNVRVKFTLYQAMQAQRGWGSVTLIFL